MPLISGSSSGGTQGTEIGYTQSTSSATVSTATEASGDVVITASAFTFDGAPVLAHFWAVYANPGASSAVTLCLFEGTTEIGRLGTVNGAQAGPFNGFYRFSPSSGSHTYRVLGFVGGAGNPAQVAAGAGGTGLYLPMFLRFTKV